MNTPASHDKTDGFSRLEICPSWDFGQNCGRQAGFQASEMRKCAIMIKKILNFTDSSSECPKT